MLEKERGVVVKLVGMIGESHWWPDSDGYVQSDGGLNVIRHIIAESTHYELLATYAKGVWLYFHYDDLTPFHWKEPNQRA